MKAELSVNVDHVATLRNARGGDEPDPVRAAALALDAGAAGVTVHLREDRRHIREDDLTRIRALRRGVLNLEMARLHCDSNAVAIKGEYAKPRDLLDCGRVR